MPKLCNCRLLSRVWHRRATAFRPCARTSRADVRSSRAREGRRPNHHDGMHAASATCTWHSVSSGFFPPESLTHPRQEQEADGAQRQVADQAHVAPTLVVIQSDLAFL